MWEQESRIHPTGSGVEAKDKEGRNEGGQSSDSLPRGVLGRQVGVTQVKSGTKAKEKGHK